MATCVKCGSLLPPAALSCPVCNTQHLPGGQRGAQYPLAPMPTLAASGAGATGVALVTRAGVQHAVVSQMVIGREAGCQLQLSDQEVSRRHALVDGQGTAWSVTDLGSRNGTFVNDQQVFGQSLLRHGDRLRLGSSWEAVFVELALLKNGMPPQRLPQQTQGMTQTTFSPLGAGGGRQPLAPAGPTLNNWGARPPLVEGYVMSVIGPQPTENGGKAGKAFLALFLGILISPFLIFLPFALGKNQILSTVIRVEQISDKSVHDIVLLSDLPVQIEGGDLVAVWAKRDSGWLRGITLYSYRTGASFRFKK